MDNMLSLLGELTTVEFRRHLPTAQLTRLVASFMGQKSKSALEWLPAYSKREDAMNSHPDLALAGVQVGVATKLISQGLLDALEDLAVMNEA